MKHSFLLAVALLLAACAVPQGGVKRYGGLGQPAEQPFVDEIIEVVTEPAGARVEVNGEFAGYAPVRYTARRLWRGEPGRMTLDTVKIEALPVAAGQCVQGGIYGQHSLKAPFPVRFTMTNCTQVP